VDTQDGVSIGWPTIAGCLSVPAPSQLRVAEGLNQSDRQPHPPDASWQQVARGLHLNHNCLQNMPDTLSCSPRAGRPPSGPFFWQTAICAVANRDYNRDPVAASTSMRSAPFSRARCARPSYQRTLSGHLRAMLGSPANDSVAWRAPDSLRCS
jgi:hypothetical protein